MHAVQLEFHPLAVEDAREARRWYAERSPSAAEAFMRELDRAVAQVQDNSLRAPAYIEGTRRVLLRRFPHFVVYHVRDNNAVVLAVAHAGRNPGYWKERD